MNVSFTTFGCKLNQVETESAASAFRQAGFTVTDSAEDADLFVVNTCTVTSKSEQKARRTIRRILRERPGAQVIVTGCYAQLDGEDLAALGDMVTILPLDRKDLLIDLPPALAGHLGAAGVDEGISPVAPPHAASADEARAAREARARAAGMFIASWIGCRLDGEHVPAPEERFRYRPDSFTFHSRPFLKIQDGCNGVCSYCRVTIARGASVSLPDQEAVAEISRLAGDGYREVVLTGVNLCSYRSERGGLRELLARILGETEGIRIRLSSLEPEAVTPELASLLGDARICPHFHLSVQSGSDPILRAMRRRYPAVQVERAAALLREHSPDPFLAADIIVGFPGETTEDFHATERIIDAFEPAALHVFPFSPRPDTDALGMGGRIPERIAGERADRLLERSRLLSAAYLQRQNGRVVEAIAEEAEPRNGAWLIRGTTGNYLTIEFPTRERPLRGALYRCRITASAGASVPALLLEIL